MEKMPTEDAVLEMPPFATWYAGREMHVRFIARVLTLRGTDWRRVPANANAQRGPAA
ncbi:hypothetical protein AB0G02_25780 [Actinosynnema sp. NPDC023658]|uniref:hypothetical protein n=1 Tax=Actinosynnema sp. NPDC023658 TaxID=3155465 RepID=UPI0033EFA91E